MTILPFLGIVFAAAALSLLTRRNAAISTLIGIAGLVVATFAAAAISSDETIALGGGEIVGSAYLRLFVWLGSLVALLLAVLGLATVSHRHAPGVLLGSIGAAALALSLADVRVAIVAATAGGLIGILVTLAVPATGRGVAVAARELRALAVAGALAVLAAAWIGRPLGTLASEPAVFGLAYLGFAAAVAIRFGAIPFHFWAARLADAAPEIALPMLMAWGPAAFAVVALAWADQSVAPLLLPLAAERALVIVVGVASVVLGSLAAWIQDDLEHVVGYTIIADAGIAILGLAALDPAAWEPARTWLLAFVVARSALAGWAVAIRAAFGTRRVDELRGWAIRAPLLGVAFVLIVVGSIGLPGLAAWNARATLIDLTVGGPLGLLVMLGALGPLAVYARLAWLGIGSPGEAAARAPSERPVWVGPLIGRPADGGSGAPGRVGRAGAGALAGARAAARGGAAPAERVGPIAREAAGLLATGPAALAANRVLIAALLVVALSVLSVAVSAGSFGLAAAAGAAPGRVPPPAGTEPPGVGTPSPAVPTPSAGVATPSVAPSVAPGSPPAGSGSPGVSPPPASPSFQAVP